MSSNLFVYLFLVALVAVIFVFAIDIDCCDVSTELPPKPSLLDGLVYGPFSEFLLLLANEIRKVILL